MPPERPGDSIRPSQHHPQSAASTPVLTFEYRGAQILEIQNISSKTSHSGQGTATFPAVIHSPWAPPRPGESSRHQNEAGHQPKRTLGSQEQPDGQAARAFHLRVCSQVKNEDRCATGSRGLQRVAHGENSLKRLQMIQKIASIYSVPPRTKHM